MLVLAELTRWMDANLFD